MKRLLLAVAVLLTAACNRAPVWQEVRFHSSLIESGSMTRSADHGEILDLIESTYTSFPVKLYTDEENNQFTQMEFGRSYTVPVGTWHVTGQNNSLIDMVCAPTSKYRMTKSPWFYASSYVTIQYGTTDYAIPVEVRAVGIVYDRSEVSQIQYQGQSGGYIPFVDDDFVFSQHYGLIFINGSFTGTDKVHLKVIPKTGAQKETVFYFAYENNNEPANVYGKLEGGKYFVLHPSAVTEIGGVTFSLSVPAWECALDD